MVHQTMKSPSASARKASRRIHPIVRFRSAWRPRALCAAGAIALAACTLAPPPPPVPTPPTVPPRAVFEPADWSSLPGWTQDRPEQAWPALLQSCRRLAAGADWSTPCALARAVEPQNPDAVRLFLEQHFTPHRVTRSDGAGDGLVTGYYEPELAGQRAADERFRFPVLAPPDDLLTVDLAELFPELRNKRVRGRLDGKRVVPYWSRADIEAGRLRTAGKAIAWLEDPVDLFFLQIQGSGRIDMGNGDWLRVGYADQNGHPYRSIGRVLVERGELAVEDATMPGIRLWISRHPDRADALLNENPSYVFFRELPPNAPGAPAGPPGALGVPLTPGRSVAVDRTQIPLGAPLFLATSDPETLMPLERLVLAQDTGGAIRGPVRVDLFWGTGEGAGRKAGRMRQQGRVWLIWPKGATPPAPSP